MCDEGASQPSNGWLRKVGVPGFTFIAMAITDLVMTY